MRYHSSDSASSSPPGQVPPACHSLAGFRLSHVDLEVRQVEAPAGLADRSQDMESDNLFGPNPLGQIAGKRLDRSSGCRDNCEIGPVRGPRVKRLQELVVELTDRCPLSCRHCSSGSGPACKSTLARDALFGVLADAVGLRTSRISYGGGEPTIAPLFMAALQETARLGLSAEVFTCGITFSRTQACVCFPKDLVAALSRIGGDLTLVFSLHGSCAQIHDAVTGVKGSFDLVTQSLRRCTEAGLHCTANFVPTRLNAAHFTNLVRFLESRAVDKLSVLRFVPQGRGLSNRDLLEMSREEEDDFVEELLDLRGHAALEIRTGSPFNGIISDNNVPCRAGFQKLVIQADGNVLPCEVFKDATRRDWGASINQMSLAQILDSPQFAALRKTLFEGKCAACPVHSILRANQVMARHSIPFPKPLFRAIGERSQIPGYCSP